MQYTNTYRMSFITKLTQIFQKTPSSAGAATLSSSLQSSSSISPSSVTTTQSCSRSIAKERLSVILASQRNSNLLVGVDLDLLQRDVLEVVKVCKRRLHVYICM